MTILALQLASPIIRAVDIGGADNPGSTAEVSRSDEARRDGLLARESLLAQALELGLDVLRAALRADAVGELRLGVPLDVALDLLPVVLVVADPPAQLEAVHARHRPVEDRERRRGVALEDRQRLLARGRRDDLVAPALQGRLDQATDAWLVVDDQHPQPAGRGGTDRHHTAIRSSPTTTGPA